MLFVKELVVQEGSLFGEKRRMWYLETWGSSRKLVRGEPMTM